MSMMLMSLICKILGHKCKIKKIFRKKNKDTFIEKECLRCGLEVCRWVTPIEQVVGDCHYITYYDEVSESYCGKIKYKNYCDKNGKNKSKRNIC
jgi:hypothetical protein